MKSPQIAGAPPDRSALDEQEDVDPVVKRLETKQKVQQPDENEHSARADAGVGGQQEIELVVAQPHAGHHPPAVVVHSQGARVAIPAVVGSRRLGEMALAAVGSGVRGGRGRMARGCQHAAQPRKKGQYPDEVEVDGEEVGDEAEGKVGGGV